MENKKIFLLTRELTITFTTLRRIWSESFVKRTQNYKFFDIDDSIIGRHCLYNDRWRGIILLVDMDIMLCSNWIEMDSFKIKFHI